jgi:hypothetical protein
MTNQTPQENNCACLRPPFNSKNFESTHIGIDSTNGRFGEVDIHKCKQCKRLWLHYYVTYEALPDSGRWYRGLITEDELKRTTPEKAVGYLEKLDWYFYGGPYFQTDGMKGRGQMFVDL